MKNSLENRPRSRPRRKADYDDEDEVSFSSVVALGSGMKKSSGIHRN